ncbi:MAG: glycosyltransferase [Pseudomonadota bacterium]
MKVLHVIAGLDADGAELMLKRLIVASAREGGHEHAVVSLTTLGPVGAQLRACGIDVQAIGMRSPLSIPRALWRLLRLMRAARPDIVQTWMYHADLLGGLAARAAGCRNVIWGIRSTDVKGGISRSTAMVRRLCAPLSRWVPRAIVCAADASRRAHIASGYDGSTMEVIPNGFDLTRLTATPEQRAQLRQHCGFAHDDVVIGVVGRFNRDKDHANFVRAVGMLAARPGLRFLMVGRGLDPDNAELSGWVAATGQAERFVLLGQRSDVPVCLAAMDVFCLPSRTEGFPNVVGEAMAMGLPCVVTDVGDAAMLVDAHGLVVQKEDPGALARGLDEMLDRAPEVRRALGAAARARINAQFSIERARERYDALYDRLAGPMVEKDKR